MVVLAVRMKFLGFLVLVLVVGTQAQTIQDVFSWADPVTFEKGSEPLVGYFLRSMPEVNEPWQSLSKESSGDLSKLEWLDGVRWYRLLPADFPHEMHYHFDGLAQVILFVFCLGRLFFLFQS